MHFSSIFISLSPLLGLVAAAPTPAEVAPRCGTTYYPTIMQQLKEDFPNQVDTNAVGGSGNFHVAQTLTSGGSWPGTRSSRVLQLVAFQGIIGGSYGCQLAMTFPATHKITSVPATYGPQLNVTTVLNGSPASIAFPNTFSWSSLPNLKLGQGLFGTVTAAPGTTAVINSEACASSLAFLFEIAVWTSTSASVDFTQTNSPLAGVYLTANC